MRSDRGYGDCSTKVAAGHHRASSASLPVGGGIAPIKARLVALRRAPFRLLDADAVNLIREDGPRRKVQATDQLVRVPQIGANQITWTKPDASPFGDASHRPDGSANAMTRNGERAMKSRQCLSSRPSGFFKARALGAP